ncbi:MAG: chemotaxis protein CheW [Acidobacteriota bacterium]
MDFRSGRYLTFRVARSEFAMDAEQVRGVLPIRDLHATELPDTPWLAGTATFSGQHFPVIDLRIKLNLRQGMTGRNPSIVVIGTGAGDLTGFIADCISEIVHARAHDFRGGKLRIGRPKQILDVASLLAPAVELLAL